MKILSIYVSSIERRIYFRIVLTNTTVRREMLYKNPWKIDEIGGLSGPPLKNLTNDIIKKAYDICQGRSNYWSRWGFKW